MAPYHKRRQRSGFVTRPRQQVARIKRRHTTRATPHRDRVRAQIALAAARGRASSRIAADLGISLDMVRKWRGRFAARGLDGLEDLPSKPRAAS